MSDPLFNFVHISDTHIHPSTDYIRSYADYTPKVGAEALIQAINALPVAPDFVLHTGDVAYDPDPEAYSTVREMLSQIQCPIHYLAGNHDEATALQQSVMGRSEADTLNPLHWDFEHKGVQFVGVDSNGPAEPPAGFVIEAQLEWLDSICSSGDDRPLVIATHHNPVQGGIPWLDDWMGIQNADALHQIILKAKHRLLGVFFGHIHQNVHVIRDGVLYTAAASSWCQFLAYPGMTHTTGDPGSRPGFSFVSVFPDQLFIRRYWFDPLG